MLLLALVEGKMDPSAYASVSVCTPSLAVCVCTCTHHAPHLTCLCVITSHRCFLPKIRQVLKEAHIELYTSAEVGRAWEE